VKDARAYLRFHFLKLPLHLLGVVFDHLPNLGSRLGMKVLDVICELSLSLLYTGECEPVTTVIGDYCTSNLNDVVFVIDKRAGNQPS
jgi:hypothetical protein